MERSIAKMSCFTKPRSAHTNIFLRTPDQSEHKKKRTWINKYIYIWGAIKPASKTLDYKMKLVGLVSLKLFQVVVILSRMYSKNVVMWKCEVADAHCWFLTHIPPWFDWFCSLQIWVITESRRFHSEPPDGGAEQPSATVRILSNPASAVRSWRLYQLPDFYLPPTDSELDHTILWLPLFVKALTVSPRGSWGLAAEQTAGNTRPASSPWSC